MPNGNFYSYSLLMPMREIKPSDYEMLDVTTSMTAIESRLAGENN